MQRMLITVWVLTAALACYGEEPAHSPEETRIKAAKGAIRALATALKTELGKALQKGGPVAAIEVCSTRAMPITQGIANEHGFVVGRVSLKNRNPANAPNAWQAQVLGDFERQHATGANLAGISWSETVETAGGREFRYMQPIPTQGVCLGCHGTQLSPAVSQVLAQTYPDDRATGFAPGDIRGAFVVTQRVDD